MTKFIDTAAASAFIATANSRETSKEVMEAIAFFARNEAEAVALWDGNGIGTVANLSDVWEHATNNGELNDYFLYWGGDRLSEVMAKSA